MMTTGMWMVVIYLLSGALLIVARNMMVEQRVLKLEEKSERDIHKAMLMIAYIPIINTSLLMVSLLVGTYNVIKDVITKGGK